MITTVSTVKDEAPRLERWIARNLAAGVDRMLVFLDDRDDPATAARLNALPGVVAIDASTWWGAHYPPRLNVRQRINSTAALTVVREQDPRGWMFHIDGDEVVHVDKDRLLALPDDVEAVQLATLEAVAQWEWPDDDVTVFKRLLTDEELNLLFLLGKVEKPDNGFYFRGHITGKAGLRVASDAWLGTHRAVDERKEPVAAHHAPWLHVLHYESHTHDEFVRKWTNLATSGSPVVARPHRRRLGSAMRAAGWGEWSADVADEVRRELFAATALDDREALERLGLLVEVVVPQDGVAPPASDPHREEIADALAALGGADKSRFRLQDSDRPTGRGQPPGLLARVRASRDA